MQETNTNTNTNSNSYEKEEEEEEKSVISNLDDTNKKKKSPLLVVIERPPLLKRSKTTTTTILSDHDSTHQHQHHFPGPLFPAVRTNNPPPNHRTISINNKPTNNSTLNHKQKPITTVQSSSSSSSSIITTAKTKNKNKNKNKDEKEIVKQQDNKLQLTQTSTTEFTPSLTRATRTTSALKHSFFVRYLAIFTCMFSISCTIYLQNEVTKLQHKEDSVQCTLTLCSNFHFHLMLLLDENANLHRFCSNKSGVGNNNVKVLQTAEDTSFYFYNKTDSRSVALYTVLITLIMPFILYKYLDYLPQIKNHLSTRTKKNTKVPLRKRIAYMVDVCFSVYPYAKLLALLFATIFLIAFGGLALYAVSDGSFAESLWLSWTFVADSGNHADTGGLGPRIVSVSISAGGMLIFAMMLGLVSDAISEKVDSLRKGKSEVIEKNHVLILGWSDKLGSLLKQLAIANKSVGGGVVVVLAERDKEEMELDIAKLEFNFMGTSVICRSGSPLIMADLKKVSVSKARAIIVLASDENADQSDARALRVVLSLTGVKEGLRGHVVVEMSDLDNEPLVKLVGGELIETVVAHDVIGRLMIQCALQPGLAQIWEDVLGFENCEFYIKRWPQLDELRFEDVLVSFPDAIPCGIKIAAEGGRIILNPDDDYVLKTGDEVLVIAEDDDTYAPGPCPEIRNGLFRRIPDPPKYPEKILFCGWRRDIDDMIMVLEALLAPGSELWMFNEVPEKERERKLTDGGLDIPGLENLKLIHREGNAVIRRHLEFLPVETFDSILILADESLEDSIVQSDSRSLATLLLIRDIQSKRLPSKDTKSTSIRLGGFSHSSWIREMQQASDRSIIISEILDSRTRNLVSVSRISDYVLSNELVSMALAMVAEDKQINCVLGELFAEEGNEMCIKPAEFYLFDQEELNFFDIMVRGRQRREIVIGYRPAHMERAIINPSDKAELRKWSLDDVFVVISSGK
ncbi:hypothetical protein ACFE04_022627 [Oxalis oulophora]